MNKVVLIGRITKEPEIKNTQSGTAVVSFTLAVDRDFKDEKGNSTTDFINCVAWRTQAEFIANYIKKGYLIAITGSIQNRSWQTANGENRTVSEVIVDSVKNLTPKENKPQEKESINEIDDSDLPF